MCVLKKERICVSAGPCVLYIMGYCWMGCSSSPGAMLAEAVVENYAKGVIIVIVGITF